MWTVRPGAFAELDVDLEPGSRMQATFTSDGGALQWNVHSHRGDEATVHAEGTASSGRPSFQAEQRGTYSFLWTNETGSPIAVTVILELWGAASLRSSHP